MALKNILDALFIMQHRGSGPQQFVASHESKSLFGLVLRIFDEVVYTLKVSYGGKICCITQCPRVFLFGLCLHLVA